MVSKSEVSLPIKRRTHQPQLMQDQTERFTLLASRTSATAIINKLTGSQFRLWHYLMLIDPFADQTKLGEPIYKDLPSPAEIGIAIGSSPRTVEKDMRRLVKLGLYESRTVSWQGYNLTALEARKASEAMKQAKAEIAASNPPVRQPKSLEPLQDKGGYLAANPAISPESRLNSRESGYLAGGKIAENYTGQAFQASAISPQTIQNIQTISDSLSLPSQEKSEKEKEREQKCLEEEEPGIAEHPLASLEVKTESLLPTKDPQEDQSSAVAPLANFRDRTAERFNRSATKLDWEISPSVPFPVFVKWRSHHYVKQGGHWADGALANAKSEIRNNPQRAADLWKEFLQYSYRAVSNAEAAQEAGMVPSLPPCFSESTAPSKEQVMEKLEKLNLPTLLPAVAPTVAPTPTVALAEAEILKVFTLNQSAYLDNLNSAAPTVAPTPTPINNAPKDPELENPQAYTLFSAADQETESSPAPESFKRMFAQLVEKSSMNKSKHRPKSIAGFLATKPDLESAQRYFNDPLLQKQLEIAISTHPEWDYTIIEGQVREVEF